MSSPGLAEPPMVEPARERLIRAAIHLLESAGPSGLSANALARETGMSASAMNYSFGSRAGLIEAAFEAAAGRALGWWERERARLASLDSDHVAAGWLTATVQRACHDPDSTWLVVQEMLQAAPRDEAIRVTAERHVRDVAGFWAALAADLRLASGAGDLLAAFAMGSIYHYGLSVNGTVDLPRLADAALRCLARLRGQRDNLPGWDGWHALRRQDGAAGGDLRLASAAAERMLAASARLVGKGGLQAVTHRAVAQQSGNTLANVTYHFPSKDALLRATFAAIYGNVVAAGAVDETAVVERSATAESIADDAVAAVFDGEGAPRIGLMAVREMSLAAVRDPAMRPLAQRLSALAEDSAFRNLTALGDGDRSYDHLDAHVALTITTGSIQLTLAHPPGERRAELRRYMGALLAMLTGRA